MTQSEQQRFKMLLEKILPEVQLIAKGHSVLDQKIERFHQEAKEDHHLAMDLIKLSHDALKTEIHAAECRSKERDERLAEEIKRLRFDVAADMKELKKEMALGFKEMGEKIEGHEYRIVALERKVA